MSYQVLARKWRPKNFHELIGQDHVSKALINALDTDRLHHAYLFTGTRGVGKTTLARILAKCLNCDEGITSQPCGVCSSCLEIDAGRFVDLIEVDAASRTKVEDTRELLDNVQYSPSRGRFKVYLIDEVHMLSTHSFNALLKTLEEPPPHVKFLLATTDPQKLPVTVLSRCLQFQLKNMPPERVVEHLQNILQQEGVSFEEAALWLLGRAADGSMRDALSLTDQAVAYGQGQLQAAQVAEMLGVLDHRHIFDLLEALIAQDAQRLMQVVAGLAEQAPDFAAVLQELSSQLHRLTLAQVVPEALPADTLQREQLLTLANQASAEEIQLFYQVAIEGRRDLSLAPDPRTGLEMTLLRMLAFRPLGVPELPEQDLSAPPPKSPPPETAVAAEPSVQGEEAVLATQQQEQEPAPWEDNPVVEEHPEAPVLTEASEPSASPEALRNNEDWLALFPALELSGYSGSQARNLCLEKREGERLVFVASPQAMSLVDAGFKQLLQERLMQLLGFEPQLVFEARENLALDNIGQRRERLRYEEQQAVFQQLDQHPQVQELKRHFGAQLDPGSVVSAAALQENRQH
ncbi:DNA polymerase-3 subunit gamma/tau [Marinospirillum celere]|uniref:DNA polymerase III subunit gamma/tau n=1 Tax=Marinospirillum celere TaxID=1122252 RepID=A0A1I1E8F6_9GAMM|nr:DNA polymerase III subunit gamma/tau [Marinospirillum celere]SFB81598.1 DNA polymerase-3 subunit gamma/tau [Marinospirillum celere]